MGPLPSKDAAAAFGALFASVDVPPQPVRATAATVRDAVVARRVCQVRRRCLMCCSLLSDLCGWFGACGTAAAGVFGAGVVAVLRRPPWVVVCEVSRWVAGRAVVGFAVRFRVAR